MVPAEGGDVATAAGSWVATDGAPGPTLMDSGVSGPSPEDGGPATVEAVLPGASRGCGRD